MITIVEDWKDQPLLGRRHRIGPPPGHGSMIDLFHLHHQTQPKARDVSSSSGLMTQSADFLASQKKRWLCEI